jgi:hypothetical protein
LKKVFWAVALCGWVIWSKSFKERYWLRPQGYESIGQLITLNTQAYIPSKCEGTITPPHDTITTTKEDRLTQYENRFATMGNKIFQHSDISSG